MIFCFKTKGTISPCSSNSKKMQVENCVRPAIPMIFLCNPLSTRKPRHAQERSWTSKPLRALAPEASVFAISPPGRNSHTTNMIILQSYASVKMKNGKGRASASKWNNLETDAKRNRRLCRIYGKKKKKSKRLYDFDLFRFPAKARFCSFFVSSQ